MKAFVGRIGGFSRLGVEAKVVYTCFCAFAVVGYASSAWLYANSELGVTPASARAYYLGAAAAQADDQRVEEGPELELPDGMSDAGVEAGAGSRGSGPGGGMRFEKPPRQVMETFHFHLFTVPVVLMIIAHIYMMSRHSTRTKVVLIGVANVATLLHLLVPPLVRFVSPVFAGLMFPSLVVMSLCWLWMTVWPIYEMWTTPAPQLGVPPL